jgi:hypothetical protein
MIAGAKGLRRTLAKRASAHWSCVQRYIVCFKFHVMKIRTDEIFQLGRRGSQKDVDPAEKQRGASEQAVEVSLTFTIHETSKIDSLKTT